MMHEYDPMNVENLFPEDGWQKSSFSNADGSGCVGFNITATHVGLRDTNHPEKGTQVYDHAEWAAFLEAAKTGELDLPA